MLTNSVKEILVIVDGPVHHAPGVQHLPHTGPVFSDVPILMAALNYHSYHFSQQGHAQFPKQTSQLPSQLPLGQEAVLSPVPHHLCQDIINCHTVRS